VTEGVDHLVLGAPDLATGIRHVEGLLGRRAVLGGRHPRWGTHNAIVGLGRGVYLEIIAADPQRDRSESVTIFGLDRVRTPQLVTWAAKVRDLESHQARAKDAGIELGAILEGERERPDGSRLAWRLTDPAKVIAEGLVPFLIDWGNSEHPADSVPPAGRLQELRAEHPHPTTVQRFLEAMGLHMRIDRADRSRLIATIRTATGEVELSGSAL
jgi:hypothetical protein